MMEAREKTGAPAITRAVLRAEKVSKRYPTRDGELTVLRGIDFAATGGESVAIMGPSGSGKSTLLNILGTLENPSDGAVTLNGDNPFALGEVELAAFRNRRIGFIFQEHHLLPQCTALENVLVPALAPPQRAAAPLDRARSLLARVGLSARSGHRPAELSGGERQRVAIARALIHDPLVLLADEPTGNLDRRTAEEVADLLLSLHAERGNILVTVTHSADLARRFCRRLEMNDGYLTPSTGE
jgi:lipoprotein-releasing system ATP-binding protein